MKEQKKRIAHIDLMESLAMLFVVAYHLSNLNYKPLEAFSVESAVNYYLRCIFVCCVPLFLVTNGYLMFHHDLNMKQHLRKTLRYVLLTLFWGVVTQGVYYRVEGIEFSVSGFLQELFQWRNGVIYLWYMGALVIIYQVFPLLKYIFDHQERLLRYLIVMLAVFTFGNRLINHVVTLLSAARGTELYWVVMKNWFSMFNPVAEIPGYTLVYFCLGAYLQDFLDWLKKFSRKRVNFVAALTVVIAMGVHALWFTLLSRASNSYCCTIWYGYETMTGFLISAAMVALLGNYQGNRGWKPLKLISTHTLGIYFIHMIFVHSLRRAAWAFTPLVNLPGNLLWAAGIIGLCLCVVLMLKKIPGVRKLVT